MCGPVRLLTMSFDLQLHIIGHKKYLAKPHVYEYKYLDISFVACFTFWKHLWFYENAREIPTN